MEIKLNNIITRNAEIGERKGFFADIYVNGTKVGEAKNEGGKSPTWYRPVSRTTAAILESAERYCQSIPGEIMTLSRKIDIEFFRHEAIACEKQIRRYKRDLEQDTIIVYQAEKNALRCWKLKQPVDHILNTPDGERTMFRILQQLVFPEMRYGDAILNKNFPIGILYIISRHYYMEANSLSAKLEKACRPGANQDLQTNAVKVVRLGKQKPPGR